MSEYLRFIDNHGGDQTTAPIWFEHDTGILYIRVNSEKAMTYFAQDHDFIDQAVLDSEVAVLTQSFVRDTGADVKESHVVSSIGGTIDEYNWLENDS